MLEKQALSSSVSCSLIVKYPKAQDLQPSCRKYCADSDSSIARYLKFPDSYDREDQDWKIRYDVDHSA